jgi:hypothetical protein
MACNTCETNFRTATSVVVSITRVGTTANLYVQNQGRNIVHLRRIIVCSTSGSTFYLRPAPAGISWNGAEYLEPGATLLYYSWTPAAGSEVQAQAEYTEIDGRSRSCSEAF